MGIGADGSGYCQKVPAGSTTNDFITVFNDGNTQLIRKSGTCPPGQFIFRERCVTKCP